jgi:predicted ATP-grasp superfamily ATP-dependent carboligase
MQNSGLANVSPALVLGLSPTGLIAIRSLGRHGIPVFGADFTPWGIGRFSKYCRFERDISEVSQKRDGQLLCAALIKFASNLAARPVLYVTNDEYIELLCPHFTSLRDYFIFSTRLDSTVAELLGKTSFYRLCNQHRVELPGTFFPEGSDDVRSLSAEVKYPAIIKPAHLHRFRNTLRGKKVVQIADAEELIRNYDRLAEIDRELIIQEVIPGPDSVIFVAACYFDEQSQPKAMFVGRKLRQYPPRFGSASLAESLWEPQVAQLSVDFLQRIKFTGICGTEYKRDPRDGRLKMMEINPRLTLWMGLTGATGVDVAYIAYQDLTGGTVEPGRQVDGVKWTYLIKDMQSSFYYFTQGEQSVGAWWRSMRGCEEEAIIARDDLKMAWYIPAYAAARVFMRYAK